MRRRLLVGVAAGGGVITPLSELFQTTLYTGAGGVQDVTTNLDYTAREALVWIKNRDGVRNHSLYDTVRGVSRELNSNSTAIEGVITNFALTDFKADGIELTSYNPVNESGKTFVAWSFLKESGFFDVVQYIGDGVAGKIVPHDLGSDVGLVIVKNRDQPDSWVVQHKDVAATETLFLDLTSVATTDSTVWDNTDATSTDFTVGTTGASNANGENYIAYVFAHNPTKGIYCGAYTGTGLAGNKQTTGFAVGWVIVKRTDVVDLWGIFDITRNPSNPANLVLQANSTSAEVADSTFNLLSDGFDLTDGSAFANANGGSYIYMAIADPSQL